MNIDINIPEASAANSRLISIAGVVNGIGNNVQQIRHSIDPMVLDHLNLRERLQSAVRSIESASEDILALHRTLAQNIELYEKNEKRAIDRVQNLR